MNYINNMIYGDCLKIMKDIPDNFVDSIVCDPPYGLSKEPNIKEVLNCWLNDEEYKNGKGFMDKEWDTFVPNPVYWKEVFRIMKPGAHGLIFSGTRTYDLLVLSLRLAGFEIRDQLQWVFSQGMPKGLNVGKKIKDLEGWSTSLKPANEPICMIRKPISENNIVDNILKWGTGALNIGESRIGGENGRWATNFILQHHNLCKFENRKWICHYECPIYDR